MENIAAIIGAASGIVSLLTIIYLVGFWKGKIDTQLSNVCQSLKKHPPEETALMAKTLWDIYVVDALRNRPDLADHHSSYKLRPDGEDLIPDDIKQDLRQLPMNPGTKEDISSGWLVVKFLGLERVSKMAEQKSLSVQEAIAVLSTFLDENNQHA